MGEQNAPLGHHLYEVSKAELEPKTPADAEDDDLPVEMAAFEKIIDVQHRATRPRTREEVLSVVLDRRQERTERRTTRTTELRKKAAEATPG